MSDDAAAAAVTITGLRKTYGRTVALDGLEVTIPRGVICGFIGPNGAGKTTTFGCAGGLIRPDAGAVDILGYGPVAPGQAPHLLSMLPQDCELTPHVPVERYLTHLARLQGMTKREAQKTAARRLEEVALDDRAGATVKELSHGMKRRVAVAQALLGDPQVVLLDEPTSGLDPQLVIRMRELFASHRGDRTLVISSHNLLELEAVCDHVVFIQAGRCVRSGTIDDVTQRGLVMRYWVERPFDLTALAAAQDALTFQGDAGVLTVTAPQGWTAAKINATVVPHLLEVDAGLVEIRHGQTLEDVYMEDHAAG
ncbi:MAG: ABC transporter ATP-binding protein [Myxococcota bacterium]